MNNVHVCEEIMHTNTDTHKKPAATTTENTKRHKNNGESQCTLIDCENFINFI